jgi:hypothetical protein
LGSQHFNSNEELMEDVGTWLSSQLADFFNTGMQKLMPLNSGSDYFEK